MDHQSSISSDVQKIEENPSSTPQPPPVSEIPKGMDLINYTAKCLGMGCDPHDTRKQLMAFGLPEANAEKIVADTIEWMGKNPHAGKAAGGDPANSEGINGHMFVGIFCCIIGLGVTIFSFLAANSGDGGGRYIIAWGAVVFGIVEILRGFGPSKRDG